MDCRTFHRRLEDYLEDGLDFPARFGMERHAGQCYACEKDLAAALELRQRVRAMGSVSAPPGFESALLARIRSGTPAHRFGWIESLWLFGLERSRWRTVAAAALLLVFAAGATYYFRVGIGLPQTGPARTASDLSKRTPPDQGLSSPAGNVRNGASESQRGHPAALQRDRDPFGGSYAALSGMDSWATPVLDPNEMEFVEVPLQGPGDTQFVIRLPKKIYLSYGQPSRKFFVGYVSH